MKKFPHSLVKCKKFSNLNPFKFLKQQNSYDKFFLSVSHSFIAINVFGCLPLVNRLPTTTLRQFAMMVIFFWWWSYHILRLCSIQQVSCKCYITPLNYIWIQVPFSRQTANCLLLLELTQPVTWFRFCNLLDSLTTSINTSKASQCNLLCAGHSLFL